MYSSNPIVIDVIHMYYCKNNPNQVTSNVPLNAGVDILIQPDTNAGPVLKVPEENLKWTWDKKEGITGTWRSGWWAGPSPSAPSDCCRKTCFLALKQGVWKRVSTGWWFKLEVSRRGSHNPTGNVLIRGNKPSAAWLQSNYELAKILKWELCRACTPLPFILKSYRPSILCLWISS